MWHFIGAILYSFGMYIMLAKLDLSPKDTFWRDFGKPILKMLLWPLFIWR